jgi:hypothetical protein
MPLDVTNHLVPVFLGLVGLLAVSAGLFVAAALGALRPAATPGPTRRGGLTGRGPLRHTTRALRSIG